MERQRVSSTNVQSIGYDVGNGTLEVEFHNGGIYQYFGVPETAYTGLMRASSKGGYLNDHIKDRYRCRKLR
ncbi:MAG: KTSC domain-containing protein [Nanoarchaeota archaeon]|nr:KTSC domain-containing protein [Nanoarchaeota archaeon]